jgi:hypothetical protein
MRTCLRSCECRLSRQRRRVPTPSPTRVGAEQSRDAGKRGRCGAPRPAFTPDCADGSLPTTTTPGKMSKESSSLLQTRREGRVLIVSIKNPPYNLLTVRLLRCVARSTADGCTAGRHSAWPGAHPAVARCQGYRSCEPDGSVRSAAAWLTLFAPLGGPGVGHLGRLHLALFRGRNSRVWRAAPALPRSQHTSVDAARIAGRGDGPLVPWAAAIASYDSAQGTRTLERLCRCVGVHERRHIEAHQRPQNAHIFFAAFLRSLSPPS